MNINQNPFYIIPFLFISIKLYMFGSHNISFNANVDNKSTSNTEIVIINAEDIYEQIEALEEAEFLIEQSHGYELKNDYKKAIELHERAISRIKNTPLENDSYHAFLMAKLASKYEHIDQMQKSVEINNHAIDMLNTKIKSTDYKYPDVLEAIAINFKLYSNYSKAIEYSLQTKKIYEERHETNNQFYASTIYILGTEYFALNDNTEAFKYFIQAKEIFENCQKIDNAYYTSILSNLGTISLTLGKYSKAMEYMIQAKEIYENRHETECRSYAIILKDLGDIYMNISDQQRSIEYYLHAKETFEKCQELDNLFYASTLMRLGMSYTILGDISKTLEYCLMAKAIYEKCQEVDNNGYQLTLTILGTTYLPTGQYNKALEYFLQAKEELEKKKTIDSSDYASILNCIGSTYLGLGDYKKAIEYSLQAKEMLEKYYNTDNQDYAETLNYLGEEYFFLGEYEKSVEYLMQAKDILEKIKNTDGSNYARILISLGFTKLIYNDYHSTMELLNTGLNIIKRTMGSHNKLYMNTIILYIKTLLYLGDTYNATNIIKETYISYKKYFTNNFSYLPIDERQKLWIKNNHLKELSSIIATSKIDELYVTGYDCILFSKGILLNSELELSKLIKESGSIELENQFSSIISLRKQLNKIYKNPIKEESISIDSLQNKIIELERELMKRSKEFGEYTNGMNISMEEIKNALGVDDAAIEVITHNSSEGSIIYSAYLLKKNSDIPLLVDLFEEQELELFNNPDSYKCQQASQLIWGKLVSNLDGIKNVYFAPDGILNQIAVEYLPNIDGDGIMSERYNIHRLSSTRKIALNKFDENSVSKTATVYGGIIYDNEVPDMEAESLKYSYISRRGLRPSDILLNSLSSRGHKEYLKHTKIEGERIDSIMNRTGYSSILFSGTEATEESFKNLSGQRKSIIHIATHGFYWEKEDAEYESSLNNNLRFMVDIGDNDKRNIEDKALTRTGLYMAGANNILRGEELPESVEDGILTAQEIANLDLRDLDLVVLSACQTGMGDISGDGVFGLQRGFKKAGANSILMSLWDVDDKATQILMTEFYKNYLGGMSKHNSLKEAQRVVRETSGFEDPQYWAAFILLDGLN